MEYIGIWGMSRGTFFSFTFPEFGKMDMLHPYFYMGVIHLGGLSFSIV